MKKKNSAINIVVGAIIVGLTSFYFVKTKSLEAERKLANEKISYFYQTLDLINNLNGKTIAIKSIPNVYQNFDENALDSIIRCAIVVKPGGCKPCIEESISFYLKKMAAISQEPLIIGCFNNERHALVWFSQRKMPGSGGYILPSEAKVFTENPYFAILRGNRIISLSIWDTNQEALSKELIESTLQYYY